MEYNKVNIDEKYSIDTNGVLYNNFTNSVVNVKFDERKNCYTIKLDIRRITIHIELAKQFLPNPDNYKFVVFIDGNRKNYSLDNLRWSQTQNISLPKEKKLKEVNSISSIQKLEDEIFVNFNNEKYNHYLISNYGRIFNTKSGHLYQNKERHNFVNCKFENEYNIVLLLLNHFNFEDIKYKTFELIAKDEVWKDLTYENYTHYKFSNYGRLFNMKTGLFKNFNFYTKLSNGVYEKETNTINILLELFGFQGIKITIIENIQDDEEFIYFHYKNNNFILTNFGRCFSLNFHKPKEMKPKLDNRGYLCVKLSSKELSLHRLVGKYFLEPIVGKNLINHIDGDKTNNKVSNLEYCTHSENTQHYFDNNQEGCIGKTVLQLDENKNIVNEFETIGKASKVLEGKYDSTRNFISSMCRMYKIHGLLRKYKGFYWVFKTDWIKE